MGTNAHTKTSGGEPDYNALELIQNRAGGVGLSAARAGGGRGLLRMAGALFRSASGSFLSATGQGSAAGSHGRICTRAADNAAPTVFSRFQTR